MRRRLSFLLQIRRYFFLLTPLPGSLFHKPLIFYCYRCHFHYLLIFSNLFLIASWYPLVVDPLYDYNLQQQQQRILKNSQFDDFTPRNQNWPLRLMMSQHSRRKLPRDNPRKGKHAAEADKPALPKATEPTTTPKPSNRLLAGYLAHEFLTKGTLLGRKFELDSARSGLGGSTSAEPRRSQLNSQAVEPRQSARKEHDSYVELARILKIDGTHISGIVNPTQLSKWINK